MSEPLRPYQARVEFLSLKEEVDKMRRAGHSVRAIFDKFKSGGHVTMCYSSFSQYVKKLESDGNEVINETLH